MNKNKLLLVFIILLLILNATVCTVVTVREDPVPRKEPPHYEVRVYDRYGRPI